MDILQWRQHPWRPERRLRPASEAQPPATGKGHRHCHCRCFSPSLSSSHSHLTACRACESSAELMSQVSLSRPQHVSPTAVECAAARDKTCRAAPWASCQPCRCAWDPRVHFRGPRDLLASMVNVVPFWVPGTRPHGVCSCYVLHYCCR